MSRRNQILVALAVIALISPVIPTAIAVHVLLDHDHDAGTHSPDPETGLHGHSHDRGTPSHEHALSAPSLATSALRWSAPAFHVLMAFPAPTVAATGRLEPGFPCEAVARASPTARRTSVLRI
jgi:hypothetical protein